MTSLRTELSQKSSVEIYNSIWDIS